MIWIIAGCAIVCAVVVRIHAASAFLTAACTAPGLEPIGKHYGPTLEALSKRLGEFDD